MLAMCTKGPSFPSGIPDPNVAVNPTAFAINVLNESVIKCDILYIRHIFRKKIYLTEGYFYLKIRIFDYIF